MKKLSHTVACECPAQYHELKLVMKFILKSVNWLQIQVSILLIVHIFKFSVPFQN
jgi:hypothetical protein